MKNHKKRIYPSFGNFDTLYHVYFSEKDLFCAYYSTYPEIFITYNYEHNYNMYTNAIDYRAGS